MLRPIPEKAPTQQPAQVKREKLRTPEPAKRNVTDTPVPTIEELGGGPQRQRIPSLQTEQDFVRVISSAGADQLVCVLCTGKWYDI